MRQEEKKERDEREERMVSSLLKDFKCFEYGGYLIEEFKWILGKNDKELKKLFQDGKLVMEALTKMMEEKDFTQSVRSKRN